jgi:glycosyltransferase involved in cell wall biosynthesis
MPRSSDEASALAMDVSVVICTYNRAESLRRTLVALQSQRVAPGLSWELVLVDNNSNDRTREVVEAFKAGSDIPTVSVFEGRQGKSFALNTGLDAASGELLAFTDDDCRPEPTWIQDVVDCVQRWGADALGGRILPDWSKQPPSWLAADRHLWTSIAMLDDREVRRVELGPWQREHGFRVWGANMAVRRSGFDVVGGFDHRSGPRGLKKYSHEDIELVKKLIEAGKVVMYDPTPTVHHWVSPERMRKGFYRWHSFYYGEGSAFRNGAPMGRHVLGIPPHLLRALVGDVIAWIRAALRRDPETFCYEREIHESIGYLSGYIKCAMEAGQYARLHAPRIVSVSSEKRARS